MKKAIENALSKMVHSIVHSEPFGWPPVCYGTIYQPKMPDRNRIQEIKEFRNYKTK